MIDTDAIHAWLTTYANGDYHQHGMSNGGLDRAAQLLQAIIAQPQPGHAPRAIDVRPNPAKDFPPVSLVKLVGMQVADITGYLTTEFGDPVFKMCDVVFVDGTGLACEGEHDLPYLVSYNNANSPATYNDELLTLINAEDEDDDEALGEALSELLEVVGLTADCENPYESFRLTRDPYTVLAWVDGGDGYVPGIVYARWVGGTNPANRSLQVHLPPGEVNYGLAMGTDVEQEAYLNAVLGESHAWLSLDAAMKLTLGPPRETDEDDDNAE